MAVPRPVLLALLGLALCAAAFLATRGAQEPGASSVTAVPATPAPAPAAKPAAPAGPAHHAAKPAKHDATPAKPKAAAAAKAPAVPHTPLAYGATVAAAAPTAEAHRAAGTKPATRSATPAVPAKPPAAAIAERVKSALAQGKVVVFFFTRAGAADDTATRGAVHKLRGLGRVMVVNAGLEDLTAYSPVLSGAGVSQVPSVVVVKAQSKARLIEGYVDPGTLRQTVADALR